MTDQKLTGSGGCEGRKEGTFLDSHVGEELWMDWEMIGRSTCSDTSINSCGAESWVLGFAFESFEVASKVPG